MRYIYRQKIQLVEIEKSKHHVCQSILYPRHFYCSNPYREEHVHTVCLSKHDAVDSLGFFLYIFRIFLTDVKRAFDQLPNPPFLFFSSIRPFVNYQHPLYVTRSTSTNTSESPGRLMQSVYYKYSLRTT